MCKKRIRIIRPGSICRAAVLFLGLLLAVRTAGVSVPQVQAADDKVTIVMIGDMLMHGQVVKSGRREDGSYNFDHLFSHVRDEIEGADIAIVNQETILGGEKLGGYTGYPSFNSPQELGDAEAAAGFDVILHATNHALDRGYRGVENSLRFWETAHPKLEVLGIHDSAEDQQELCIIDCKGMRIAILNYTYGTNGIQMPAGKGYLVDILSEKRVRADIERAEAQADFTVVCPHWGTEYKLTASADQKRWAEVFLSEGADLVIGTHPHVIEPVEVLTGADGHEMLCYYSLGNFVNATSGKGKGVMNRMVGGMAEVSLKKDTDGQVVIDSERILPVINHLAKDTVTAYFLSDYTEELAQENLAKNKDATWSLEACYALVERVWPGRVGQYTAQKTATQGGGEK